jgi:Tfp pilus assembly protein PilF
MLDSIHYPAELSKPLFAEYVLLSIQAKDKACKDISKDTLIFQVKNDFRGKGDLKKTILSEFYSGRVYHVRQEYKKAMNAYLKAETLSEEIQDDHLKGLIQSLIGELYYTQELYSKAIEKFQLASDYFGKNTDSYKQTIVIYNIIGTCYFILNELEEDPSYKHIAFSYFDKALKLAESQGDFNQIAIIRLNLGIAFSEMGETRLAKMQLFQALELDSSPDSKIKIYLGLAKTYVKEQQDSAMYFAHLSLPLVEKENNKPTLLNIYRFLSSLEEKNNHYQNALHYHQQYFQCYDAIQVEKENANLLELQKKYDYEIIKGVNNRLIIELQGIILAGSLLVICIVVILFVFFRKEHRNKESLAKAKQTVSQLKKMIHNVNNEIHPFLVRQFDIVKKVSLLDGYLMKEEKEKGKEILKKVNKIIYEQDNFDWEVLYMTMNKLHKGYFDRIKELFPELSELEYRICCLTKSDLNNTEIAIILQSNVNIIQIRKTAIRKKLGICEYGGDISLFLDSSLCETKEKPL